MLVRFFASFCACFAVLISIASADEDLSTCAASAVLGTQEPQCVGDFNAWETQTSSAQTIQTNTQNTAAFTSALIQQLESSIGNSTLSLINGKSDTKIDASHYGEKIISVINSATASNISTANADTGADQSTIHAQHHLPAYDAFAPLAPMFENTKFEPFNVKKDATWK